MYKVTVAPTTEPVTKPIREDVPNNTSGIYQILCTKNGKMYVGSAVNVRKRWNNHIEELKNQKHGNSLLCLVYLEPQYTTSLQTSRLLIRGCD